MYEHTACLELFVSAVGSKLKEHICTYTKPVSLCLQDFENKLYLGSLCLCCKVMLFYNNNFF